MEKITALREKANKLPLLPGVYLMKDDAGEVIYVGKAKALKNRVTSYFRGDHLPKVAAMVSHVEDFSVILAATEFEALVLENSLIKRYQPHYNILLRDDKTYPFLRLDEKTDYPVFSIVNRQQDDGAHYFGPYGGRSVTKTILETLSKALGLPACGKKFPRDIGKERPCLNFHMHVCEGWCRGEPDAADYRARMAQAVQILSGGAQELLSALEEEMLAAAAALQFERAAMVRDRMRAVQELSNHQTVIQAARADTDAVGFCRGARSAFVVLHYTEGDLAGKDLELMSEPVEEDAEALSALVRQYYERRGVWPKVILLPELLGDAEAVEALFSEMSGHKVALAVPQRGARREMMEAAQRNAREESLRSSTEEERQSKTLEWLQKMLGLEVLPRRIEAFDISNTGDFGIVASMIVFVDGKPLKKDYRRFHMKDVVRQDDFASMFEAVSRRLAHFLEADEKFMPLPDLLLIDGGQGQASAAASAAAEHEIDLPIFGMVKDSRHHTRALTDVDGREIGIQANPAVFALVGTIQEEAHRFAGAYHKALRSRTIASQLEEIPGVGEKRRQALLRHFQSVKAIRSATAEELSAVIPRPTAQAVYDYFHIGEEK